RVDVSDEWDFGGGEPIEQRAGGAPVRRRRRQFPDYDARHARPVGLDVFRIDAVVADHRGGHHHDLTEIGGIGEDLLVPAQICGEDDFRVGGLKREGRRSREPGAVLEQDVSGFGTRAGDWGRGLEAALEESPAARSVEFRWEACSGPAPAPVAAPRPRAPAAPATPNASVTR